MTAGLEVRNDETGEGIVGKSVSSVGVRGESGGDAGVVGHSSDRDGSSGIVGSSDNGTGVEGHGHDAGVYGESQWTEGAGVYGFSPVGMGVFGSSTGDAGVAGSSSQKNYPGVYGEGPNFGVHGEVKGGQGGASSVGVSGYSALGAGVSGDSSSGVGIHGHSTKGFGVFAQSDSAYSLYVAGTGFFAGDVDIHGFAWLPGAGLQVDNWLTVSRVQVNDMVVVEKDLFVFGKKSAAIPHPDGSHRVLYAMESPESWFEDFGRARLVRGKARVRLDRTFAAIVRTGDYHVFLSPEGESQGLYVRRRTRAGFDVREQHRGTSTMRFSYRVVARRKDITAPRFEKIRLPKPAAFARAKLLTLAKPPALPKRPELPKLPARLAQPKPSARSARTGASRRSATRKKTRTLA